MIITQETKAMAKSKKPKKMGAMAKKAQAKAKENAKGLTKEERKKLVAEAKKQAKQKRARIRDYGQAIPDGYLRRKGSLYFALKENYRPDKHRNSRAAQAFVNANHERFFKDGGYLDSTSRNGNLGKDGDQNLRQTTSARKLMDKAKAYAKHATGNRKSKYMIYWGQDGKTP